MNRPPGALSVRAAGAASRCAALGAGVTLLADTQRNDSSSLLRSIAVPAPRLIITCIFSFYFLQFPCIITVSLLPVFKSLFTTGDVNHFSRTANELPCFLLLFSSGVLPLVVSTLCIRYNHVLFFLKKRLWAHVAGEPTTPGAQPRQSPDAVANSRLQAGPGPSEARPVPGLGQDLAGRPWCPWARQHETAPNPQMMGGKGDRPPWPEEQSK